jgi:hypothetical protein
MSAVRWLGVVVALGLALSVAPVQGQEPAPETPKVKEAKPTRAARVVKPWSLLKSLSAEQRAKIAEVHAKFVAERKKLDEQERDEVMALLSDEQKAELVDAIAADEAAKKARRSEAAAAKPADEKPADDKPARTD